MIGTLAFRDNLIPRPTTRILSRLAKGRVETSTHKISPQATQDILEAVPKLQSAAITRREDTKAVADLYLLMEHIRVRKRQALGESLECRNASVVQNDKRLRTPL